MKLLERPAATLTDEPPESRVLIVSRGSSTGEAAASPGRVCRPRCPWRRRNRGRCAWDRWRCHAQHGLPTATEPSRRRRGGARPRNAVVAATGGAARQAVTPGDYEYTVCTTLRVVDLVTGRQLSFAQAPGTLGWVPPPTTDANLSSGGGELAAE